MGLPLKLKRTYLDRLNQLIAEGDAIAQSFHPMDTASPPSGYVGRCPPSTSDRSSIPADLSRLRRWTTNCCTVLAQIIPKGHPHAKWQEGFASVSPYKERVLENVAFLRGIGDDFDRGLLDDLGDQIEAEVAADYMGQAEQLLKEGQSGKYDHVPAAVLAGAVLEKGLRTLCGMQTLPVVTIGVDGKPPTLNPLIDALKKSGAFNELTAKQLRAWADIRNKAAHGEFDQFKREDVELMLKGVNSFLANHLK